MNFEEIAEKVKAVGPIKPHMKPLLNLTMAVGISSTLLMSLGGDNKNIEGTPFTGETIEIIENYENLSKVDLIKIISQGEGKRIINQEEMSKKDYIYNITEDMSKKEILNKYVNFVYSTNKDLTKMSKTINEEIMNVYTNKVQLETSGTADYKVSNFLEQKMIKYMEEKKISIDELKSQFKKGKEKTTINIISAIGEMAKKIKSLNQDIIAYTADGDSVGNITRIDKDFKTVAEMSEIIKSILNNSEIFNNLQPKGQEIHKTTTEMMTDAIRVGKNYTSQYSIVDYNNETMGPDGVNNKINGRLF